MRSFVQLLWPLVKFLFWNCAVHSGALFWISLRFSHTQLFKYDLYFVDHWQVTETCGVSSFEKWPVVEVCVMSHRVWSLDIIITSKPLSSNCFRSWKNQPATSFKQKLRTHLFGRRWKSSGAAVAFQWVQRRYKFQETPTASPLPGILIREFCSSWNGRPFGHYRHGPKSGGLMCPFPWWSWVPI